MSDLKTILYVEDEPDIREIARISLAEIGGFEVEVCSSGDEALERAAGHQAQLVLIDVMMPGMDGPTTLDHLRRLPGYAQTPVIFMTAKVQPREVDRYMELGALGVIAKPFDPMALAEEVRRLWSGRNG